MAGTAHLHSAARRQHVNHRAGVAAQRRPFDRQRGAAHGVAVDHVRRLRSAWLRDGRRLAFVLMRPCW